ncbi:MAG TPA: tetratricopeptide repeat protein [Rhizomicrobium sp.]|nr:tetratricopeptide repeat protein [Rhizomicrobium sp.]
MSRTVIALGLLLLAAVLPLSYASAAVEPVPFSLREPPFDAKISGLLTDAQKAIRDGKLKESLQILNLAHSLAPNNPYVLARLATVLNLYGDPQGALDRLRRAQRMGVANDVVLGPMLDAMLSLGQNQNVLDLYPDPGPDKQGYAAGMVLRARASALQMLGDSMGASEAMKRSLAILKNYDGVMTAGRIALMQGAFDAAEAYADESLKLAPGNVDALMLKIDLAMQRRMPAKAQQMADKLVADNPRSVSALLTRIKVYLSTDRADKAEADIDRIITERPNVPIVQYFKAVVLARHNDAKGAWDIAHSLPKEYIQVDPGVALNVASMAVAAGYLDSAASILNVAVFRFPYQMEARLLLADLRLRQKSPEHAINVMQLVKDSRDPRVMIVFARIALMKKDPETARKYIERVLDAGGGEELRALDKDTALRSIADYAVRHPGNKVVKKQRALLLLGFGELPKAKALYEQLVREDPSDALAFNNLAWLVVQENPHRALGLAQSAVKADPALANYLDTLGTMQLGQSDFRGAVTSLQKAHDLAPDNAGFAYHLALALEASGASAQSQAILQMLVKRGGFSDLEAAKNLLASKLKLAKETQSGR